MKRTSLRLLLIAVVCLVLLVYIAQMFTVTQVKQSRDKAKYVEMGVGRILVTPSTNLLRTEAPKVQKHQTGVENVTHTEMDFSLDDEIDISQNKTLSFETRMEKVSDIRRKRVEKTCSVMKILDDETEYPQSNIYVSDKYKVLFCGTDDVNSNNWKMLFEDKDEKLSNETDKDETNEMRLLSSFREESISYRLKYYYKFMIVRHPLVRFLAAYKSWLLPHAMTLPNGTLDRQAEELFNLSQKIRTEFDPENFYNREPNATKYARLADFAAHVIAASKKKKHLHPLWERHSELCQPCRLSYDFILRAESIKEDSSYILSQLKLLSSKKFPTGHMDSSGTESIQELRAGMPLTESEDLYKVYREDFELFGYPAPWR